MTTISTENLNQITKTLTLQADASHFDVLFKHLIDTNVTPTIYVEEKDAFAFDFYNKEVKKAAFKINVETMPIKPDADWVKRVAHHPGIVASVLQNNENGVAGMPYIALGHPNYALDTYASYFSIIGLMAQGNTTLAKQIIGNISYQIGHVNSLKPTNTSAHQNAPSLPLYTSMVKEVAVKMAKEEDRRAFLNIHIKRSILEYNRQWENTKLANGLNTYPDLENSDSTSFKPKASHIVPVRLNMMLYKTELDIAHFIKAHTENDSIEVDGKTYNSEYWNAKAQQRLTHMDDLLWTDDFENYHDFDTKIKKHVNLNNADFIYALWAQALPTDHAKTVLKDHMERHLKKGYFVFDNASEIISSPEQMILWLGLLHYNQSDILEQQVAQWKKRVETDYKANQSLAKHYTANDLVEKNTNNYSWTLAAYSFAKSIVVNQ